MVSVTSARPSGGRPAVPANTTSSILPPRSGLTPCSPMTQENASTTLDLPDPFGPTTQVIPCSNCSEVAEAKDLNPRRVSAFRYTCRLSSSGITPPVGGTAPWLRFPRLFGLSGRLGQGRRLRSSAPYRAPVSVPWIPATPRRGQPVLSKFTRQGRHRD